MKFRPTGLASIILVGGVVVGTAASASMGGGNREPILRADGSVPDLPAPLYEENARGESYGSALDARVPGEEPDLIEAYATNGRRGYVRRTDLEGDVARTPSEAKAQMEDDEHRKSRTIPVYEADGVTVIGAFVMAPVAGSSRSD